MAEAMMQDQTPRGAAVIDQPWQIEMYQLLVWRQALKTRVEKGFDLTPGASTKVMRQLRERQITRDRRYAAGLRHLERWMVWMQAAQLGLPKLKWMEDAEYDEDWQEASEARAAELARLAAEKEASGGTEQAAGVERPQ